MKVLKDVVFIILGKVLILGMFAWRDRGVEQRIAQAELRGMLRTSNYFNEIRRYEKAGQFGFACFVLDDFWLYIDSLYDAAGEQMPEIDTTTIRIRGAI